MMHHPVEQDLVIFVIDHRLHSSSRMLCHDRHISLRIVSDLRQDFRIDEILSVVVHHSLSLEHLRLVVPESEHLRGYFAESPQIRDMPGGIRMLLADRLCGQHHDRVEQLMDFSISRIDTDQPGYLRAYAVLLLSEDIPEGSFLGISEDENDIEVVVFDRFRFLESQKTRGRPLFHDMDLAATAEDRFGDEIPDLCPDRLESSLADRCRIASLDEKDELGNSFLEILISILTAHSLFILQNPGSSGCTEPVDHCTCQILLHSANQR